MQNSLCPVMDFSSSQFCTQNKCKISWIALEEVSVLQGLGWVEDGEYQEEFISKIDPFLLMLHRALEYGL